ncbi:MAG TPA: hypothetical protein DCE44_07435, partial [Verrucomicrobiales bacterium]|nr:hypothetical protein [Verrucomicrobiales bacterium]
MRRHSGLLLGLLVALAFAAGGSAAAATNQASLFGFTNLWTIHLTISPEDWQTLGSRGVVQRNNWGGGPNYGGGGPGNSVGTLEGFLRGVFGGGEPPRSSPP